jgi:hypothetical protein
MAEKRMASMASQRNLWLAYHRNVGAARNNQWRSVKISNVMKICLNVSQLIAKKKIIYQRISIERNMSSLCC